MLPNVCANLSQIVGPLPSTLTAPSYYQQKKHDFRKKNIYHNIYAYFCVWEIYMLITLRIFTQNLLIVGLIHCVRKLEKILMHTTGPHLFDQKKSSSQNRERTPASPSSDAHRPCLGFFFSEYNVQCVILFLLRIGGVIRPLHHAMHTAMFVCHVVYMYCC